MTAWAENDELFKQQLLEGRKWEQYVCQRIENWGFDPELGVLKVRDHIDEAAEYADQVDLKVMGYVIEVKSRDQRFTNPDDFPFDDVFIDTVRGIGAKTDPDFYVCVSQYTKRMIALPVASTRKRWQQVERLDRVRGIRDLFYTCDKEHWKDEIWLRWALTKAAAAKVRALLRGTQ